MAPNFLKNKVTLILISIVLGAVLFELLLRSVSPVDPTVKYKDRLYASYTKQELDKNITLYDPSAGGNCVYRAGKTFWNPYYGINLVLSNIDCIKKLFNSSKKKVVFMGGSVMANHEAPNYLTTIDYYVHEEIPGLVSVNLAEGGWRSTNEMIRLLLDVVDLRPDAVVFLDGYNEFLSIQNDLGQPEEDIYSTAYKVRMEHTVADLGSRIIARTNSYVLELLFFRTGLIRSSFSARSIIPADRAIQQAAQLYLDNIYKITVICKPYGITPLFFLQPVIFTKKPLSVAEKEIAQYWSRKQPGMARSYSLGYDYIMKNTKVPVTDLSNSINTTEPVFFDACHMNKLGNKMVGQIMAQELIIVLPH
jgi:hypothetical protein